MTNLDHILEGVYDTEVREQLDDLLDGLWYLDRQHPELPAGPVQVSHNVLNKILTAYRKLID